MFSTEFLSAFREALSESRVSDDERDVESAEAAGHSEAESTLPSRGDDDHGDRGDDTDSDISISDDERDPGSIEAACHSKTESRVPRRDYDGNDDRGDDASGDLASVLLETIRASESNLDLNDEGVNLPPAIVEFIAKSPREPSDVAQTRESSSVTNFSKAAESDRTAVLRSPRNTHTSVDSSFPTPRTPHIPVVSASIPRGVPLTAIHSSSSRDQSQSYLKIEGDPSLLLSTSRSDDSGLVSLLKTKLIQFQSQASPSQKEASQNPSAHLNDKLKELDRKIEKLKQGGASPCSPIDDAGGRGSSPQHQVPTSVVSVSPSTSGSTHRVSSIGEVGVGGFADRIRRIRSQSPVKQTPDLANAIRRTENHASPKEPPCYPTSTGIPANSLKTRHNTTRFLSASGDTNGLRSTVVHALGSSPGSPSRDQVASPFIDNRNALYSSCEASPSLQSSRRVPCGKAVHESGTDWHQSSFSSFIGASLGSGAPHESGTGRDHMLSSRFIGIPSQISSVDSLQADEDAILKLAEAFSANALPTKIDSSPILPSLSHLTTPEKDRIICDRDPLKVLLDRSRSVHEPNRCDDATLPSNASDGVSSGRQAPLTRAPTCTTSSASAESVLQRLLGESAALLEGTGDSFPNGGGSFGAAEVAKIAGAKGVPPSDTRIAMTIGAKGVATIDTEFSMTTGAKGVAQIEDDADIDVDDILSRWRAAQRADTVIPPQADADSEDAGSIAERNSHQTLLSQRNSSFDVFASDHLSALDTLSKRPDKSPSRCSPSSKICSSADVPSRRLPLREHEPSTDGMPRGLRTPEGEGRSTDGSPAEASPYQMGDISPSRGAQIVDSLLAEAQAFVDTSTSTKCTSLPISKCSTRFSPPPLSNCSKLDTESTMRGKHEELSVSRSNPESASSVSDGTRTRSRSPEVVAEVDRTELERAHVQNSHATTKCFVERRFSDEEQTVRTYSQTVHPMPKCSTEHRFAVDPPVSPTRRPNCRPPLPPRRRSRRRARAKPALPNGRRSKSFRDIDRIFERLHSSATDISKQKNNAEMSSSLSNNSRSLDVADSRCTKPVKDTSKDEGESKGSSDRSSDCSGCVCRSERVGNKHSKEYDAKHVNSKCVHLAGSKEGTCSALQRSSSDENSPVEDGSAQIHVAMRPKSTFEDSSEVSTDREASSSPSPSAASPRSGNLPAVNAARRQLRKSSPSDQSSSSVKVHRNAPKKDNRGKHADCSNAPRKSPVASDLAHTCDKGSPPPVDLIQEQSASSPPLSAVSSPQSATFSADDDDHRFFTSHRCDSCPSQADIERFKGDPIVSMLLNRLRELRRSADSE